MSFLRRAALRTILAQPTRQYAAARTLSPRVTSAVPFKLCTTRAFHLSRVARAEEEKREEASTVEASTSGETVTTEPSVADETIKSDLTEPSLFHPVQSEVRRRAAPELSNQKVVFVANLSFELSSEDLKREFSMFGEVVSCQLASDSRGLSRGFAHIEFATVEQAESAVQEMHNSILEGRKMIVQPHAPRVGADKGRTRTRPPTAPCRTLFVGNLSFEMSDRDLNDLFRPIRNVVDIRVAIDRRSGQPRGFAHADFIDVPSAQRAKEYLESKVLYGRQLRVDWGAESGGFEYRARRDKYYGRGAVDNATPMSDDLSLDDRGSSEPRDDGSKGESFRQ